MMLSPYATSITFALLLSVETFLFANASGSSLRGSDADAVDHQNPTQSHRDLQDNQVGLFLIKQAEAEMGNSPLGQQHRNLQQGNSSSGRTNNIQLSDGTVYEVKNAQAGWANNLVSGKDRIRIPPGAIISSDGSIDMKGQKPVTAQGIGQGLFHRDLHENDAADKANELQQGQRQLQSGTKTVLAVRVILKDAVYSFASQTELSNDVFGNGVDPHNLKSQYAACSYDQIVLNKSPDRNMSTNPNDGTTAISSGVVDVKVNLNASAGDGSVVNAVTTKINSVFGVTSPNQLANHVMYCLPSGVMTGIAYAYVNSWNSVYSNEWCNYLSAQMHEIGHNLGYSHSNEGTTSYADQVGVMGYSYGYDDLPVMCFNAAKSWQTKWYTSKSTVVDPSAGNCFEGNVYGIADFSNPASSTVLVKIDDASATDFYVAFNRWAGINSGTQEAGNLVTVVTAAGEGNSYAESNLLAKLGSGGSWSGVMDGKTMVVNVLSINTSASPAYAQVRISENGTACGPVLPTTPSPSASPTLRPTSSPTKTCLLPGAPLVCGSNGFNAMCCSGVCYKSGNRKNTCK